MASFRGTIWIQALTCFSVVVAVIGQLSRCGGYLKTAENDGGTLTSLNYPGNYPPNTQCIWLIEAPSDQVVISLTVSGMQGQGDPDLSCQDFLEIRNGSATHDLLYYECDDTTTQTMSARYIWIRFFSNNAVNNRGFTATWTTESQASDSNVLKPWPDCPMEFRCSNKECVPRAYLCDGYNDCGVTTDKHDEHNCQGLGFTTEIKLAIGIGSGFGFFCLIFFGIGILDILLKRRSERKYQERMEQQKKLLKQKKAKNMASLLVAQPSIVGTTTSGDTTPDANTPSPNLQARPSLSYSFVSNGSVPHGSPTKK